MKNQRRYKDLEAEEINHLVNPVYLTVTLPSGKTCEVDSRSLIINCDATGSVLVATMAGEGIPFYKTTVRLGNVVQR